MYVYTINGIYCNGDIVYIIIWMNYNDLSVTSLEWWLVREIIPKWPQCSAILRSVNLCNIARNI